MCVCVCVWSHLSGLSQGVLCAFGDGAQVSAIDHCKNSHGRDDHQHKRCKTGGHVELEEDRNGGETGTGVRLENLTLKPSPDL